MSQALFRIGGCYASKGGSVMRIESALERASPFSHYFQVARFYDEHGFQGDGSRFLDGSYFGDPNDEASLTPGELHQVDGQWVAVESRHCPDCGTPEGSEHGEVCPRLPSPEVRRAVDLLVRRIPDPNAAMLARDAAKYVPRPPTPAVIQEPKSTALPAVAGLMVVGAVDHRLGSAFR